MARKSEFSSLPEEEETDNFPVQIAGQGFNAFKDAIAHLETGGLLPGEKYVRTGYSAGKGSSAFGPYQINRDRVKDMLKDAGISVSVSKGDPKVNYGRSEISFSRDKKRSAVRDKKRKGKGIYTPKEIESLKRLYEEQTEGLRIGGETDREKFQKQFGFSDEYADAYDYSMSVKDRKKEIAKDPNAPLRKGIFRLTESELEGIRTASEKELNRHYQVNIGDKSPALSLIHI